MKLNEFKKEVLPLRDKLFRIALRITCNEKESEDIVQDVMLKMWELREEWNSIDSKEAYCCMMSRNLALGRLKLKDNQTENIMDTIQHSLEEDILPSTHLEQQETKMMIRNLIRKLPDKERAVMELRDWEEMSYKEVALTLQITEAQVKINLFRARKRIKELFSKLNKNDYSPNL
ncbi:MAG: sigma-70 family RNA polymerase sigma factor [Bacteroides sp.]|nr:sigma-70 family RNA polymerase sigma factor [Bacteroides sp.]